MNDLSYALRQLRRTPGFTLAAAVTIGLGVGATTAIFSVVNAILLRPLPVAEPDRLINIQEQTETRRFKGSHSLPEFQEYRARADGTVEIAGHHLSDIILNTGTQTRATLALDVSANYFDVLGIRPALGRFFGEAEARAPGAAPVAVISHELWQNDLGGDPAVVGSTVHVNSRPLTVIGVAPEGFHGTMLGARPRVWLPLGLYGEFHPRRNLQAWGASQWIQMFGRLEPGIAAEQAEAALTVIARQLAATHEYFEGETPVAARVRSFSAVPPSLHDGIGGFVTLLLATAALVLAIATVNVSGMLLARAAARGREIAVRLALGARRRRLVGQLLVESVLLALLGGGIGIGLAIWLTDLLSRVRPPGAGSFALDLGVDVRVLAFALAVSLVVGVLFGLAPAFHATRRSVNDTIKGGSAPPRRTRLRSGMVVGQLALSLVLLVAAGLFVRTMQRALDTPLGFDPENVLAVELNLTLNRYGEDDGRAFYDALLERVRALPGAESATLARMIPLGLSFDQTRVRLPDDPPPGEPGVPVGFNIVSEGYLETLRMPLLEGRTLTARDGEDERVILINRTFARRFWPDESPVGQRVQWGSQETTVVGVVPDGKYQSYTEEPTLFAYQPLAGSYSPEMWLHVRVRGDVASLLGAIRREIRSLDPNVAPITVTTVEDVLGTSLFAQRLAAWLIGGFGLVGLVLAALGLCGLLSFVVAQRTREIGLRMALGAGSADVVRMVLGYGMKLLAVGAAVGVAVALVSTRLIGSLLHGVSPADPITLVVVVALLGAVVLLTAALPARRASRIEPMEALRYE